MGIKVYIVNEFDAEGRDSTIGAFFNRDKAEELVENKKAELERIEYRYKELEPHMLSCTEDECDDCREYFDLQSTICWHGGFNIDEVEVV